MGHGSSGASPMLSEAAARLPKIPWWAASVAILAAVLCALGGVIALAQPAMLAPPQSQINSAVHVYAAYMAARNFAIAVALTGFVLLRARHALAVLVGFAGLVQLLDVVFDCFEARWAIIPGVLFLGLLYLVTATRLAPFSSWREEA